jgi:hypothetical protein
MRSSLRQHLATPSIAVTKYGKATGRRIGKQGAANRIAILKENRAIVSIIDESTAIVAGELLLKDEKRSTGDSLIACYCD